MKPLPEGTEEPEAGTSEIQNEFVVIDIATLADEHAPGREKPETETKICRVCHAPLGGDGIELGCLCKNELSLAHRQCAETWFQIKGSKTCEICRQVVQNIAIERVRPGPSLMSWEVNVQVAEDERNTCKSLLCNLLLAFCFVIPFLPWLFRVHIFKV